MSPFVPPLNFENDYFAVKQQALSFDRNAVKIWTKENDVLPLNYTINAYPKDEEFTSKLNLFVNDLTYTDPNLLWYPKEKWHMTIIGLIPVISTHTQQEQDIVNKVGNLLFSLKLTKLTFRVCGCSSNDKAASVLCYPTNINIAEFRSQIRSTLGIEGKSYAEYLNTFERICWINIARYPQIPSQEFVTKLQGSDEIDFGDIDFGLHLRRNASSTLSDNEISKSEVVHTFI
jgi:hypothetical protein